MSNSGKVVRWKRPDGITSKEWRVVDMKAIFYTPYGPPEVRQMADLPKPAPRPNEVLVKIRATTVTIGDCRMRRFPVPPEQWLFARLYLGVFRPRRPVLGMELAGDVEAVGAKVTRLKPGDPVFAPTFDADWGGYAEYKCFPENGMLAPKPSNLDYGESAAMKDHHAQMNEPDIS
jgi:NADPH:quinone reductase-like Zn-dependent oxidoreductase